MMMLIKNKIKMRLSNIHLSDMANNGTTFSALKVCTKVSNIKKKGGDDV